MPEDQVLENDDVVDDALDAAAADVTESAADNAAENAGEVLQAPGKPGDKCFDDECCEDKKAAYFTVSVPYTIKPYAIPGKPEVECVGREVITHGHMDCKDKCEVFKFTCSQKICVKLPVKFGAITCVDDTCVEEDDDQGEDEN